MKIFHPLHPLFSAFAVTVLLTACGSPGFDSENKPVWPEAKDGQFGETSVVKNQNDAHLIKGMSKRQVMELIGEPHYGEGFGAKVWNHVLVFHKNGKAEVCQLKTTFNDGRLNELFWRDTERCGQWLK